MTNDFFNHHIFVRTFQWTLSLFIFLGFLKMIKVLLIFFIINLYAGNNIFKNELPNFSEEFKLYSVKFYVDITKSKFPASSIVVPSIFEMHLINRAQFLNATRFELSAETVIVSFTSM